MSDGKVTIDLLLDPTAAIASASKAGAKIAAAAAAAVGAASGAVAKKALDLYASYEQLAGGVDTLFTDAADTVKSNADAAFKTAGLSANQYMETVTSFSASLIKSMGGDTEAAAAMADVAIRDMADNANKMGTSMETIQQTYSSLARGNYAMLDNLKIGYGGTKAELEKLLDDAEAYKAANGEMAEYSIDNFADIVEAIHVVQEAQGIAGATALEAATTIEGSVNSMKAAWDNWLTGLGNPDADMDLLTDQLVESIVTAANNVIPRVGVILSTLGSTLYTQLSEMLPKAVEAISQNGVAMGEQMLATGLEVFAKIGDAIVELTPQILQALALMLASLLVALVNKGVEYASAAGEWLVAMGGAIAEKAHFIVDEIGRGITDGINRVKDSASEWIQAGKDMIGGLIEGIKAKAGEMVDAALGAVQDAVSAVAGWLGIHSPSRRMRDEIGKPMAEGVAVGFEAADPFAQISRTVKLGAASLSLAAGGSTTYNNVSNVTNFNQPVQSAAQVARAMRLQQAYGLAGAR